MATTFTPKTEYAKKLLDPRWQKLRLQVFERDKFTCRSCGATDKTLHAHHVFYRAGAEGPWDCQPSDIVTVCNDCHDEEHAGWRERDATIIEALTMAGARTNAEVKDFTAMITEVAEAIAHPGQDVERRLFTNLQRYIDRMRANRSGA